MIGRILGNIHSKLVSRVTSTGKIRSLNAKKGSSVIDLFQKKCLCKFSCDEGVAVKGDYPKNYVNIKKIWIDTTPDSYSSTINKTVPAGAGYWETVQMLKPSYFLDYLYSYGKGQGSLAVKNVVMKSLNNPKTRGRVVLHADIIDGKTSPAGFYYKMGFRFTKSENNKIMADWLKKSGKREDAPMLTGYMYLPSGHINHCLNC